MISLINLFESISVITDKNLEQEKIVAKLVSEIINEYSNKIPVYVHKIVIKSDIISHSHPILTLNTRFVNSKYSKLHYLKLLIHENLHYFEEKYLNSKKLNILQEKYKSVFDSSQMKNLNSFLIHIVVIWNTLNILKKLVNKKEFDYLHKNEDVYPNIENWIVDNFKDIGQDLKNLNLIWI